MSKTIVGVSVTPELGLEVAQIDFVSGTVLKYGVRQLAYDMNRREIADMDIFREALQDLFLDLQIPKNLEVVVNIPTVVFKISDYPASLDEIQISGAIEEDLSEHYVLKDSEPAIAATVVPSASMQFSKIAYTAAQKSMLVEMSLIIKEMGYKVYGIGTSVASILNSLLYIKRVDVSNNTNWVLAIVENATCRVLLMNGGHFVDCIEERISIGEVLDDAENYSTVVSALQPILKSLPSKYLCVVSKTDVISAEVLASKLKYSAPIIHQEANCYLKGMLLNVAPSVDPDAVRTLSLDVIGACIFKDFERYTPSLNMFNKSLGEVFTADQPPEIPFLGGKTVVLTTGKLISLFITFLIILACIVAPLYFYFSMNIANQEREIAEIKAKIATIDRYLEANKDISTNLFDEGDEIRIGLEHNKKIYSYFTIVGTEIPKKLWLTALSLGKNVTISGQADNLESVYSFYRNVKDYDPASAVKLQELGLASTSQLQTISDDGDFETDSILTSLNADFYEFKISDLKEKPAAKGNKKATKGKKSSGKSSVPKKQIK